MACGSGRGCAAGRRAVSLQPDRARDRGRAIAHGQDPQDRHHHLPLAIGLLTGKYLTTTPPQTRGEDDQRIARWNQKYAGAVAKLQAFAAERGYTSADAANAWLLSHPAVTSVIVGISRLDQLQANLKGAEWSLTDPDRQTITSFFPTAVAEEAGGQFHDWRRSYEIIA
jgi:hypothetical protein